MSFYGDDIRQLLRQKRERERRKGEREKGKPRVGFTWTIGLAKQV